MRTKTIRPSNVHVQGRFWSRGTGSTVTKAIDPEEIVTFGKHTGQRWADLPLDYLYWIARGHHKLTSTVQERGLHEMELRGANFIRDNEFSPTKKREKTHILHYTLNDMKGELRQNWHDRWTYGHHVYIDDASNANNDLQHFGPFRERLENQFVFENMPLDSRVDLINRCIKAGIDPAVIEDLYDSTVVPIRSRTPARLWGHKKWSPQGGRCKVCGAHLNGAERPTNQYLCPEHQVKKPAPKANATVTAGDVVQIKIALRDKTMSRAQISKTFGISKTAVHWIAIGSTWKDVRIEQQSC